MRMTEEKVARLARELKEQAASFHEHAKHAEDYGRYYLGAGQDHEYAAHRMASFIYKDVETLLEKLAAVLEG